MKTLRKKVYDVLETSEHANRLSLCVDSVLVVLIVVNVITVVLESVSSINEQYHWLFARIEWVSIFVFSVEYLIRLWVSPEHEKYQSHPMPRLRYMCSPLAIIDFLAVLPFYLGYFFAIDLRFLRVLRLLRILKLTRYSAAMVMLLDVFKEESSSFFAGLFILTVLLILAASGAYLAEHNIQPDKFGSIPAAMWWSMATLTTVGYGDVTPVTVAGKIFGACVTVVGIGMAALPAAILANGLASQLNRKRALMTERFQAALEDGYINDAEEIDIEALRKELGLSVNVADSIRERVERKRQRASSNFCPHCGEKTAAGPRT